MGIMICRTHGQEEFWETCPHIAEQVEAGMFPSGRRLSVLGHLFVCEDCFNSLGFQEAASLAEMPLEEQIEVSDGRWEAFNAAYEALKDRRIFCFACVAELERRNLTQDKRV